MENLTVWLRNMICFLCFFQVFLHLAPKEQYRKYLKFFGDLLLVFLVMRPMAVVLGKEDALEKILRTQSLKGEYSEMEMHMEGVGELKTGVVEKAFRREMERQMREIPEAYGFSVLDFSVKFGEGNRPEGLSMKLLFEKAGDQEERIQAMREEIRDIYGVRDSEMEILVRGTNVKETWDKWQEALLKGGKNRWVIFLLAGLILLIAAVPAGQPESPAAETEAVRSGESDKAARLGKKLEQLLSRVEGVGEARVLVTLKSDGKHLVEKDESGSDRSSQGAGEGSSTSREINREETTVYKRESGGAENPYVAETLEPEVAGVLVAAEGGGDPVTVNEITEAVQALFGVDAHKIKVMKMN